MGHLNPAAKHIAAARTIPGLTTTKFDKHIGVTNSYISALEAGRRTPSRQLLVKINRLIARQHGPNRTIRAIVKLLKDSDRGTWQWVYCLFRDRLRVALALADMMIKIPRT